MQPDMGVESVAPISSGFMSSAFFVTLVDGSKYVLIRSFAPKHRAWACQLQAHAEQGDIVCQFVHKSHAEQYGSVDLVPACNGGEMQSFPVFMGFPGEVPSPALCQKFGMALAKFHKVGTAWHEAFASEEAYARAGHPALHEACQHLPHLIYDDLLKPGTHSIVQYQLNLLKMVLPEELQSVDSDASFLEAEVRRWTQHSVLPPAGSLLAKTVTGHGDLHGANVLTHEGEPVIIDLECAYVGPAGWDVATFYQCLRRYQPEHDYAQVSAFARGYLREVEGVEPSSESIDEFLFDTICWWYFANMKQAACLFVVQRLCGVPAPPAAELAFAHKTLGVGYLKRFVARIAEVRAGGAEAMREFAKRGCLDF